MPLQNPTVSVKEVTGTTPIFYLGTPVVDGSLEATRFVSVLWWRKQVDKSQLDAMTPTISD